MAYIFLTGLARLLTRLLVGSHNFHLRGAEHVPRTGPLLIVSNHVAGVDPALIGGWTPRPVWFMAKMELFRQWFSRWICTAYHAFPVVRHSADRTALKRALNLLRRGEAVVLFPEGHRSDDAGLLRAEPGAGFLARHSKAPVVPLGITGSQRVLSRKAPWVRRVPVEMVFGEPFALPERNPDGTRMDHQQSADLLMTKIAALLPVENRGAYKTPQSRAV